jgi:8-oxo-dGTP diphosphatase
MKNIFTLPAYVGIILKKDTRVLLVKRCNTDWAAECWNFPGGLLEENETLLFAAIRETEEELGIIVAARDFSLVHVLQVKKSETNTKDIIGFYFMAEKWEGVPVNNEPHKHSDIGWFEIDNLPSGVTEHAKLALHGLLNGVRYSEN